MVEFTTEEQRDALLAENRALHAILEHITDTCGEIIPMSNMSSHFALDRYGARIDILIALYKDRHDMEKKIRREIAIELFNFANKVSDRKEMWNKP